MIETKLILFEVVAGSGKSTLAQTIVRRLGRQGIPAHWWYEEDANHPVYIFQDQQSLRRHLDQLSGQYREVITDALEQRRRFVESARAAEDIVLIDGCLFGYLTWSPFHLGIPELDIHAYLPAVKRIIAPFPLALSISTRTTSPGLSAEFSPLVDLPSSAVLRATSRSPPTVGNVGCLVSTVSSATGWTIAPSSIRRSPSFPGPRWPWTVGKGKGAGCL